MDNLETNQSSCFSCCYKKEEDSKELNKKWAQVTFHKMDEIFRLNNIDQIPEWFEGFMEEYQTQIQKVY